MALKRRLKLPGSHKRKTANILDDKTYFNFDSCNTLGVISFIKKWNGQSLRNDCIKWKVKFRNRRIPIFWTGEFAHHLSERNVAEQATHPYKHIQAQKLLQICTEFKKTGKSYVGTVKKDGVKIFVIFFIKSNFAIIKTCYRDGR